MTTGATASKVLQRLGLQYFQYLAHVQGQAFLSASPFMPPRPPPPWIFAPEPHEVDAFADLARGGYICRLDGDSWTITLDGSRVLLRGFVPADPVGPHQLVLDIVGRYDIENKTRQHDPRKWIHILALRKRMFATTTAEKDDRINALDGWFLRAHTETSDSRFFKLTEWGWLASSTGSKALSVVNSLIDICWDRHDRDIFSDITYTLDDLRKHGAQLQDTDLYFAEELIASLGDLGLTRGAETATWILPIANLTTIITREYETAHDYLDDRRISLVASKHTADILNTGYLRTLAEAAYDVDRIDLLRRAARIADDEPWSPAPSTRASSSTPWNTVGLIIKQFKLVVEHRNLWRAMWHEGEHRDEKTAQLLFLAVAESYCKANNLDIIPEAETGRGPVDFKISSGHHDRLLVEVKLSSSRKLLHGYQTQLELYKEAQQTTKAVYLIVSVGTLGRQYDQILELQKEAVARGEFASEVVVVDATPKASASTAAEA